MPLMNWHKTTLPSIETSSTKFYTIFAKYFFNNLKMHSVNTILRKTNILLCIKYLFGLLSKHWTYLCKRDWKPDKLLFVCLNLRRNVPVELYLHVLPGAFLYGKGGFVRPSVSVHEYVRLFCDCFHEPSGLFIDD